MYRCVSRVKSAQIDSDLAEMPLPLEGWCLLIFVLPTQSQSQNNDYMEGTLLKVIARAKVGVLRPIQLVESLYVP